MLVGFKMLVYIFGVIILKLKNLQNLMKYIVLVLLLLSVSASYSQTADQSFNLTASYTQTNPKQSAISFASVPPPDRYGRRSNVTFLNVTAQVLGGIGGALVGWQLGTYIGGGEPNWTLAAVGGGLIAVAIPLEIIDKNRGNGRGYRAQAEKPTGQYNICLVSNRQGVGIAVNL